MEQVVTSSDAMMTLGEKLGRLMHGGEVIELIGDVGAGKTTFTKGIAKGLGVDEDVQSPTFTISRVYNGRDDLQLAHYDFYRLVDAGILSAELHESTQSTGVVTVVEWGEIVAGVLPKDTLHVAITSPSETERRVVFTAGGIRAEELMRAIP